MLYMMLYGKNLSQENKRRIFYNIGENIVSYSTYMAPQKTSVLLNEIIVFDDKSVTNIRMVELITYNDIYSRQERMGSQCWSK